MASACPIPFICKFIDSYPRRKHTRITKRQEKINGKNSFEVAPSLKIKMNKIWKHSVWIFDIQRGTNHNNYSCIVNGLAVEKPNEIAYIWSKNSWKGEKKFNRNEMKMKNKNKMKRRTTTTGTRTMACVSIDCARKILCNQKSSANFPTFHTTHHYSHDNIAFCSTVWVIRQMFMSQN